MYKLILINLVFALLLVWFLIEPIRSNWAWLGLITSWCVAEGWLSRDPSIRWWQWTLLFICLAGLDAAIYFSLT